MYDQLISDRLGDGEELRLPAVRSVRRIHGRSSYCTPYGTVLYGYAYETVLYGYAYSTVPCYIAALTSVMSH